MTRRTVVIASLAFSLTVALLPTFSTPASASFRERTPSIAPIQEQVSRQPRQVIPTGSTTAARADCSSVQKSLRKSTASRPRAVACVEPAPPSALKASPARPHADSTTPLPMPDWCRQYHDGQWHAQRTIACQILSYVLTVWSSKRGLEATLYFEVDDLVVTDARGVPWDQQIEILFDEGTGTIAGTEVQGEAQCKS